MLITTAAATSQPVSLEEAKTQLNLDASADFDQLAAVEQLIASAAEFVEGDAAITLQPTEFEQRQDCWPCGPLALATGPVRAVTQIVYLDEDGEEQELSEAEWDWEPTSAGGVVWLLPGFTAPSLACRPGAVRIRFSAGFNDPEATEGDPRLELPQRAKLAVLMLTAHWFLNRDAQGESIPAADRMINAIRVFR